MPTTFSAPVASDAEILTGAISLEQQAIWTYMTAGKSGLLSAGVLAVATKIAGQHQDHANALSDALTKMGGTPPTAKDKYDLPSLTSEKDVLHYALKLETIAANAYFDAFSKLSDKGLKQAGISIMNDETQHVVILRGALGMAPVDVSFMPLQQVM